MSDPVNHPEHYQSATGLEAITVIEAFFLEDAHLANVFKYIAREGKKGTSIQDLRKARWYLNRAIDRREAVEEMEAMITAGASRPTWWVEGDDDD